MGVTAGGFDYDWLVVGSGFGGSVSALRLAEKGYSVGVLEAGRRYRDEDFAKSTWNLKRFLWAPALGLRGILKLTPFKDVFIASGSGVGGGSIVYANTLYRAAPEFFSNPQWAGMNDWAAALAPHYDTAERMLGVQVVPRESDGQKFLRKVGEQFGVGDTFRRTPVGVYFGQPGATVPDPYFGGEGPQRTGCTFCGACMVGCREGAKNTLLKNYLWFAEKRGAEVIPDREVTEIRPIGAADGSDGYMVTTQRPGAWFSRQRRTFTARGIVISAGALGTNRLLARCKLKGTLPNVSERLGQLVRTNSESILVVTVPEGLARPWNDVAISASIYPKPDTHIEFVTYGRHGDFMSLLYTLLTPDGTRLTRPLRWLAQALRHPITFARSLWPVGWSRRSMLFLVMQSLDNAISFRARRGLFGGVSLTTQQDPEKPNPTYIEVGNRAAEWLARQTGGYAQSMLLEAFANIPTTAHILGGAVIGRDAASGVVDTQSRLFGYRNFLVCDGSTVPANPGVNPSLTITAMTEYAMSQVPGRTADWDSAARSRT
ncbi:MAG TPA: GMC family oxidoreductase [Steroidobacteraceae bacterium]|nr:GMC family oxidoreductase [Steroidobacteraceae bacterium]